MDFAFSESTAALLVEARLFAARQTEGPTTAGTRWQDWGEAGWLGLCLPDEHGGAGRQALDAALAFEAFGRAGIDRGLLFAIGAHLFGCAMAIANHGTQAQREAWLPRLASGAAIGALAFTEPAGGSDFDNCATLMCRDGDNLVVKGAKTLVTNGAQADVFLLLVKAPETPPPFGYSILLLPRETPGLAIQPIDNLRGMAQTAPARIELDDCTVPQDSFLGKEGAGLGMLLDVMRWERSCILAGALGALHRDLRRTTQYLHERQAVGSKKQHQSIAHALADIRARLEAARWLLLRGAWDLDNGDDAVLLPAISKYFVSETIMCCTTQLRQLIGGAAWTGALDLADALDDAFALLSASGTSQVQLNTIYSQIGRGK